jgi:hypothetical protein
MAALAPLSSLGGPASETAFPPNPRPPAEGEFRAP